MNLSDGTHRNKLVFATLIPDQSRAVGYADKLAAACPEFSFQVRVASKTKVVYKAAGQSKLISEGGV